MSQEPKYRPALKKTLTKMVDVMSELQAFGTNHELTDEDIEYVSSLLSEQNRVTTKAIKTKKQRVEIHFPSESKDAKKSGIDSGSPLVNHN